LIEDIYFQIEPFKNRRAEKLSGGMKQKLAALDGKEIHHTDINTLHRVGIYHPITEKDKY
jgi:ABC-type Na+ transport system ATPase subunit NatA